MERCVGVVVRGLLFEWGTSLGVRRPMIRGKVVLNFGGWMLEGCTGF